MELRGVQHSVLCNVHPNAVSNYAVSDSAVCILPAMCIPRQNKTRRFASHGRIKLGDVHPTAESDSRCASHQGIRLGDVYPTAESDSRCASHAPRNQTRQCASHLGIKPGNLHPMAESNSAMCIPQQNQTQRCASHRGIRLSNVHPTEESDSGVCKTVHHAEESVTCLSWPKRVCFYMRFKKKNVPCNMPLY